MGDEKVETDGEVLGLSQAGAGSRYLRAIADTLPLSNVDRLAVVEPNVASRA
jgi:hypothetical protein